MRIGLSGTGLIRHASIERITTDLQQAADEGFRSYWIADHPSGGFDALTVLAIAGQSVPGIELGTAIVPTFPRHPMALAAQALTVGQALGGRLTLGIGLSHISMMAELGIPFEKPIRHLREYLSVLLPLLSDGHVDFHGELYSTTATVFQKAEDPPSVLVAALGPQALKVAGRMAAGTTLAWVGPKTIREHIVPTITAAAEAAGRPAPRIAASLPVCVTSQPDAVRASIAANMGYYGTLPSYRAMFDREGVDGPADVAIVGSRTEVADQIHGMAMAGVTDFSPNIFGADPDDRAATRDLLRSLLPAV
ncbi:MAG: TIGR03564 family F420-dependent LLM class oxidoreductase [Dehalococcoidia bacterium]